ncbi:MFS transporter [Pseudolactococcus plantarum]|uniref:Major facilitator superfamily (MFS) profile domain-containing protein n=1 Tax=Pseudolactococcus plantarum TaxID=1365 RepID=A0A2A5RWV0_9LACT|nr:MFS transporter [Lactococcus plantarum]PCS05703.1 hypothetical protein RU87_GL000413 [Lactococcus plantarum]HCN74437.1 MFS transporter [Lactococcus sp.]
MMRKLSILLLSLFPLLAGAALSPALSEIARNFPGISELWIKSLVTIPSICVVIGQIVMANLPKKLSPRWQVLAGLLLYACGFIPYLWSTFPILVVSRIILGIGLSLLVPWTVGFIQLYFSGNEQKVMLGYASGLNNLGTVIAVLYSGIVSGFDWHFVFFIYLLALLSFLMSVLFLPEGVNEETVSEMREIVKNKSGLSINLIMVWIKMFLLTVIYFIIPTNLSFYMATQFHQHNTMTVGVLMSVLSLFGVIAGMLYARVLAHQTSRIQEVIIIAIFAAALCLLSFATTLPVFIIGLLLTGWGLGWGLPYLNAQLLATVDSNASNQVGIGQSMIFLGQFVSPFMISVLAKIGHQENPFIIGGSLLLIFIVLMFIDAKQKSKISH